MFCDSAYRDSNHFCASRCENSDDSRSAILRATRGSPFCAAKVGAIQGIVSNLIVPTLASKIALEKHVLTTSSSLMATCIIPAIIIMYLDTGFWCVLMTSISHKFVDFSYYFNTKCHEQWPQKCSMTIGWNFCKDSREDIHPQTTHPNQPN